jgi:syntaxin 5
MQDPNLRDCRDRTEEFFSIVQSLQRQNPKSTNFNTNNSNASKSDVLRNDHGLSPTIPISTMPSLSQGPSTNPVSAAIAARSKFTRAASHIGQSIVGVTEKLERLAEMAGKKSLFHDASNDINKLTYTVKQDIIAINKDIETLSVFVKNGNSETSTTKHSEANSVAIIDNLKSKLATTTKSFTDILQLRSRHIKDQSIRLKEFESTQSNSNNLQSNASTNHPQHPHPSTSTLDFNDRKRAMYSMRRNLQQDNDDDIEANDNDSVDDNDYDFTNPGLNVPLQRGRNATRNSTSNSSSSSSSYNNNNLNVGQSSNSLDFDRLANDDDDDGPQSQTQSLLSREPVQQTEYLASRAQAVENIQSTIEELAGMYRRLNELVATQEEVVIRIDANVEDTLANVDAGQAELLKALNNVSSSQWLIIKIFAILIAFSIFFIAVVA